MNIIRYEPGLAEPWDSFCSGAVNATFLHMRRFLSYHGDRFADMSVVLLEGGKIVGVFPAATDPEDDATVVSHPGITYGGIIHSGYLRGPRMLEAMELITTYYRTEGFKTLQYKAIPFIYAITPAQDDLYALFRHKARRYRCDLSCAVDLSNPLPKSERRKRGLKKALSSVSMISGLEDLKEFWSVLEENLRRKYDVRPTHSLKEIIHLCDLFPENIRLICASLEGQIAAGILVFVSQRTHHAQYIASSETGYAVSALDAVFDSAISGAIKAESRYFDFGISNEENGNILNEGLYKFKSEFGGTGVAYEYYEISL